MFRSLRFRLPALFLAAIVLAGLVSTAVAVSVSKRYAESTLRKQAFRQLEREAGGINQIYTNRAGGTPPDSRELERASGDQIYYVQRAKGIDLFPGSPTPAFTLLPRSILDFRRILAGDSVQFVFTPPGSTRRLLGFAKPVKLGDQVFGAVILARPTTRLNQGWLPFAWRLLPAFFAGILVAGALGWYLSRRITKPVLVLSDAADEVASGRYDVAVPQVSGHDEISHLAERFSEMAAELQAADTLERNFLMTVSHELRTPLTAIRGHVEALLEGVVEDEEARSYSLEVIRLEAERLERLVGDVLDLAKLDMSRFTVLREEVDMARLLDQAYTAFGEEAKQRDIVYSQEISADAVIISDGDRVLQIISNLLANAFRWTPDGGQIGLRLSAENGLIHVAVEDTGPGIGSEEQERIFRPFWTHDGKGTGLGLAIARELALALGGRIELDSELGRGSRFEFVLPTGPSSDDR